MALKLIYFSPDVSKYRAAFYQQDVIVAFRKATTTFFYGPGFQGYNPNDNLSDVISKSPFEKPDFLCVGHAWLKDKDGINANQFSHIDFRSSDFPKAIILNKEYTNLKSKLEFIQQQNFDLGFTHHHLSEHYERKTGIRFYFWPFAVNHNRFRYFPEEEKLFDLIFTGVLRNRNFPNTQTDVRIKVQKELYHSIDEFRLWKRLKYKKYDILWRAIPSNRISSFFNRIVYGNKKLPESEYFKALNQSRICFNTLSPMDLVGTRYYEAMALKIMVLCQRSDVYKSLFEEGKHYVAFNEDLSDFYDKFTYYCEKEDERKAIVESAYEHILKNHTWEKRIEQLLEIVNVDLL